MRKKQKNGLVETVKKFFDDSIKNVERSKGMNKSRNCSPKVEHKNGLFSNHFHASTQFLMSYEFQDYLLKGMNLYALYMLY